MKPSRTSPENGGTSHFVSSSAGTTSRCAIRRYGCKWTTAPDTTYNRLKLFTFCHLTSGVECTTGKPDTQEKSQAPAYNDWFQSLQIKNKKLALYGD